MNKTINLETFQGLNWSAAENDFDALAKEYGKSVSSAAFDAWCAKHSPSSINNTRRWHSASSIRRFFAEFENGKTMLDRLIVLENARRKDKRTSSDAYAAPGTAKKKTRGNGGNGSGGSDSAKIRKMIMDALVNGEVRELDDEIRAYLRSEA